MDYPWERECDFCGADKPFVTNCGDVNLCMNCRMKLEDEIEAVGILMEEE